jgi:2-methylaconitate cis-trans-isomerase PrpF
MPAVKESSIPCTIMRGGTSKALFFLDSDVPSDVQQRTDFLLRAFGSPDVRQVDGMGGADPLTSKTAIIRASNMPGVDVEYTFGQVSITEPFVDMAGNCGNISSAVGPYAIDKGLVSAVDPVTTVRIFNTNTRKKIVAEVPVREGRVVTQGTYQINGVPGTGAEIKMHFIDPGGAITGKLLPTGNFADKIKMESGQTVDVSIVDAGNLAGFVHAEQIGLRGDELPAEIESRADILATLEEIRAKISERLGMCSNWRDAYQRYRTNPKIAFVSAPAAFRTLQGQQVPADSMDIMARVMAMGRMHKAFAITAAIPTAAASRVPGSIVQALCRQSSSSTVRIGHPSGIMSVGITTSGEKENFRLTEVIVGRTARKLMEGRVFLPVT